MAIYDLYGFLSDNIDGVKDLLESALGIKFDIRDSDYQGGEYFKWGKVGEENFVLKRNVDSIDGEPAEMEFPKYQLLFYINNTLRSTDLYEKINQVVEKFGLLRREDLE